MAASLAGCVSVTWRAWKSPSSAITIEKIKEWNPVLIPIEGELKEGTTVKYEYHQDENSKSIIPATVKQIVENNNN